jgi:hypothetical protein
MKTVYEHASTDLTADEFSPSIINNCQLHHWIKKEALWRKKSLDN